MLNVKHQIASHRMARDYFRVAAQRSGVQAALLADVRVAPTLVLKYNIRAVRALGSARSDLAGLDEVVEGGAGDVQYLGDRGL